MGTRSKASVVMTIPEIMLIRCQHHHTVNQVENIRPKFIIELSMFFQSDLSAQ